jgi:hypothetical protein
MLVFAKNTFKEETSYEILHKAAPILLRNRSARQIDVRLYPGKEKCNLQAEVRQGFVEWEDQI